MNDPMVVSWLIGFMVFTFSLLTSIWSSYCAVTDYEDGPSTWFYAPAILMSMFCAFIVGNTVYNLIT